MSPRLSYPLLLVLVLATPALFPGSARASEDGEKLDAIHHQADAYYLDFAPFGKLELPRIFVVRRADGSLGMDVFRSTKVALEHGYVAEADASHAAAGDAHDVQADHEVPADTAHVDGGMAAGEPAAGTAGHDSAAPLTEDAGHTTYLDAHIVPTEGELVIDLSITKHLVFAWLSALIVLLVLLTVARRYKAGVGRDSAPRGLLQNLVESLVLFVRNDIVRPALGEKTDRFLPYLLTAFFFILTSNLLGLVPFSATATSNIMITAVLAVFTFVITQIAGTKDYWLHILWPPGVPAFVKPILVPVEILGLFTKPFALAIRLFANMTAGHLVILSLIGLIFAFTDMMGAGVGIGVSPVAVAFALFIYVLELLVAFIQAYVFTMLSALFIGMAAAEHEHHDAHGDDHAHALPGAHRDGIEIGSATAVAQAT